jgi:membrane-anchored protein YejM (alkaline phosphatase superfamily)
MRLGRLQAIKFLPEFSLPKVLKGYGYKTAAFVSMPVINSQTSMAHFFDQYELMPQHNDFASIIDRLDFSGDVPRFYFLNVGETHYPYSLPGEESVLPRISGLRGALREEIATSRPFFGERELKRMKNKQIECVEYLDSCLEKLFEKCPPNTHIIVTSDHGELFGESGLFGHGPVFHQKVFEVPFVEGLIP